MSLQSVLKSAGTQFERPDFTARSREVDSIFRSLAARPTRKAALFGIAKLRSLHADICKYWMNAEAIVTKSGDNSAMVTLRKAKEVCKRHEAMIRSIVKQFGVKDYQCSWCGFDSDTAPDQCPQCNATTLNPDAAGQNNVHANLDAAVQAEGADESFDLNAPVARQRIERANKSQRKI